MPRSDRKRLKVLLKENTRTWARYILDFEFHEVNRFEVNQSVWKTGSPVMFQTYSSMLSTDLWSIRKTFNSTLYFYHGYDAVRHVMTLVTQHTIVMANQGSWKTCLVRYSRTWTSDAFIVSTNLLQI